jgi:hypothetical protein
MIHHRLYKASNQQKSIDLFFTALNDDYLAYNGPREPKLETLVPPLPDVSEYVIK